MSVHLAEEIAHSNRYVHLASRCLQPLAVLIPYVGKLRRGGSPYCEGKGR